MSMREYVEMGYKVVCESMFGDVEVEDVEMAECYEEDSQFVRVDYEEDSQFVRVDEEAKVAYFEDAQDYDE